MPTGSSASSSSTVSSIPVGCGPEVEALLTYLAVEERVAAATQNQR